MVGNVREIHIAPSGIAIPTEHRIGGLGQLRKVCLTDPTTVNSEEVYSVVASLFPAKLNLSITGFMWYVIHQVLEGDFFFLLPM